MEHANRECVGQSTDLPENLCVRCDITLSFASGDGRRDLHVRPALAYDDSRSGTGHLSSQEAPCDDIEASLAQSTHRSPLFTLRLLTPPSLLPGYAVTLQCVFSMLQLPQLSSFGDCMFFLFRGETFIVAAFLCAVVM